MFKRFAIPALVFAFLATLPTASSAATIGQILGAPSTYDGLHVDVRGTVEHLEQKVSHKGNAYVTFSLCSSQCIHVFAFGSPGISDGQTITVHGTFAAVKHVSGYAFYNEIDADDASL
jgi:ABC-type hemin transport system substrate-binding protein